MVVFFIRISLLDGNNIFWWSFILFLVFIRGVIVILIYVSSLSFFKKNRFNFYVLFFIYGLLRCYRELNLNISRLMYGALFKQILFEFFFIMLVIFLILFVIAKKDVKYPFRKM